MKRQMKKNRKLVLDQNAVRELKSCEPEQLVRTVGGAVQNDLIDDGGSDGGGRC